MFKRILGIGALCLMIAFGFTFMGTAPKQELAQAAENSVARTLMVNGKGELFVKPDIAYIQLGLETIGTTAKDAHNQNAKVFANIISGLKELNIPEKDIKTVRFNTYPYYEWNNNKQELKGYKVEQILQVTYRDIDKIGTLLDKVTAAGANRVDTVQYSSEKLEEYQMQALEMAIDNAKKKADRMAKKAGVQINGVQQIIENGAYANPIFVDSVRMVAEEKSMDAGASTQVYPGEMRIEANVSVTYTY
jgi:uncharacterized protein YggE